MQMVMLVLVDITRYASKTKHIKEYCQKYKTPSGHLVVHCPPVFGQEMLTGGLKCIVRAQVLDRDRSPGNWIDTRFLYIFGDADTIKAASRRGHDRVMHDFKGNTIDQVIRDML